MQNGSVRVRRSGDYGVVGKWITFSSTESQTFSVQVGLSHTDTHKSLTDIKDTLTIGASFSARINEVIAKETVTVDVKNEFMMDFQNSLTDTMVMSEQKTWSTSCTEQPDAPGTALH